jgi:hypothetical protein
MYETPDKRERTYYTLHLYLNDNDTQPGEETLEGGATTFWSMAGAGRLEERRLDVAPKMGSILIFQQRFLLHAGDDVIRGMKMTMRTELMFEKSDEEGPEPVSAEPVSRAKPRWIRAQKDGAK